MQKALTRFFCLACLLTTGCAYFTPHRIEIQQGNKLDADSIAQVKIGMTPRQVLFLLGSPLAQDLFHTERWDYLYWLKTGDGEKTHRHLIVIFEHGKVASIQPPITTARTPANP